MELSSPWEKTPEGFYKGIITEDVTDCWYRARPQAIERDFLGRSYLVVGEPVVFETGPDHITANKKVIKQAVNIVRPFKEVGDYRTRREYCEVIGEGFAARMIGGGKLFIDQRTAPKKLRVGMVIRCGVKPPLKGFGCWATTFIEIVHQSADEFDWSSVPPEGEDIPTATTRLADVCPALQLGKSEPSSLLSDHLRSVPLRRIRRNA